jgi:hypothetical protein
MEYTPGQPVALHKNGAQAKQRKQALSRLLFKLNFVRLSIHPIFALNMFSPAFSLNILPSVVLLVNSFVFIGTHAAPTPVKWSRSLAHRTVQVVASGVPAASCAAECGKAFDADKWLLCAVQCTSSGLVEWDSSWDTDGASTTQTTTTQEQSSVPDSSSEGDES